MIVTPLSHKILLAALLGVLIAAVVFLALGSYARKETVLGWIVPEGGLVRLVASDGGRIQALTVKEGDEVINGATVAFIHAGSEVDGVDSGEAMLEAFALEEIALKAENASQVAEIDATHQRLTRQRQNLINEQAELTFRGTVTQERFLLAQKSYERSRALRERGYMTDAQLENAYSSFISAESALSSTRSGLARAEGQLADIDQQLADLPNQRNAKIAAGEQRLANLNQRRTGMRAQTALTISSPIAGSVLAVPVEPGQTLPPGSTVAVIAPRAAENIAELYVPTRAVGFIETGQQTNLMYEAYPFQRHGMGKGTVVSISSTTLAPHEVGVTGIALDEPVFRVRVQIDSTEVQAYGREFALKPGMLLKADVITDRRNLIEWLFDPIFAAARRQ